MSVASEFILSPEYKALPEIYKKHFKDTGCIPSNLADKMFPGFSKGYFSTLAKRGKIRAFQLGSGYLVDLAQAEEYATPRPVTPSQERLENDSVGDLL